MPCTANVYLNSCQGFSWSPCLYTRYSQCANTTCTCDIVILRMCTKSSCETKYSSQWFAPLHFVINIIIVVSCCLTPTIWGAGLAGKPPVLPKNGRTQSLLAAAHQAQSAAFPLAASLLSEHCIGQDNMNKVSSITICMWLCQHMSL